MPSTDLEESPELDVTIDGADQIDVNTRTMIIGSCGAQTQIKIVANASKKVVIIADKNWAKTQRITFLLK